MSRILAALDGPLVPVDSPTDSPGGQGNVMHSGMANGSALQVPGPSTEKGHVNSAAPNAPRNLLAHLGSSDSARITSDAQLLLSRLHVSPRASKSNASGFQLNYDFEPPLHPIDVGGPDQQLRMAEFVTKSIDNLSHGVTVRDAMRKLKLKNKKDIIPGLEIRLLPHQIIGVSWMVDQEKSEYKGGILADDMGLGKTVQMIATMAMNMPDLEDSHRTTLIVVPAALLQQWKDEIETKTNGIFTVHLHHGKDKLKTTKAVQSKDVVITTYHTLNADCAVPKDIKPDEELAWLAQNGGPLARVKYWRVVVDEAQFIRNRSTRSSRSVAMLRSKFRWMLTGTPVTNTLADIYGLLRFGRFRPWNDWNDFNAYIAKVQLQDAPLAGERAQSILKTLLLRRTKDSELEGEPILQLPPKDIEIVTLEFSSEERHIYDSFEKKTKIRLNKFINERTLVKHHAEVLVLILRMRQLCCHPNLILSRTEGYADPTLLVGSETDKEIGRATKAMGLVWVAEIKRRFLKRALATEMFDFSEQSDEGEATCAVCQDLFMNGSGRVLACGHEICFDCLTELSQSPIAHDGIFGYGSEAENFRVEKEYETAAAKGFRPCPTCKKMMDLTMPNVFKSAAFEPSDEELRNYARSRRQQTQKERRPGSSRVMELEEEDDEVEVKTTKLTRTPKRSFEDLRELDDSDDDLPDMANLFAARPAKRQKKPVEDDDDLIDLTLDDISVNLPPRKTLGSSQSSQNRGEGKEKAKDDEQPSDAVFATWRKGDDDVEPSAKMTGVIKLLQSWDSTGDKTICYSQWTSMLDLMEALFSRYGIQSLRYDGKMDRFARENTLAAFKKSDGPRVILISTKCGGIGLNLVAANRVINLDLSWNYASESQAYDRVHRLGQEKDVFVKRLVVKDTIEERMLQLQDVKVGLAEAALGEGSGGKLHKLSIKDIRHLFGMSNANPQVVVTLNPNQNNDQTCH